MRLHCVPALIALASLVSGCRGSRPSNTIETDSATLQSAIAETMVAARRALDAHGPTEEGLTEIAALLNRLADSPGLVRDEGLRPIHGNDGITQRKLASEGPDGMSLYLTRLSRGASTPVHDHATWGVISVVHGRDRLARWARLDDGSSPTASLRRVQEEVVGPGGTAYWLPPPADIHTQEAVDGEVWELVLTGRDLSAATAQGLRRWFDAQTGAISDRPPN